MVQPYCEGGDLEGLLRRSPTGFLDRSAVRFYASELVSYLTAFDSSLSQDYTVTDTWYSVPAQLRHYPPRPETSQCPPRWRGPHPDRRLRVGEGLRRCRSVQQLHSPLERSIPDQHALRYSYLPRAGGLGGTSVFIPCRLLGAWCHDIRNVAWLRKSFLCCLLRSPVLRTSALT